METAKTRMEKIEEVVNRHPVWKKVAGYFAAKHNLDEGKVRDMFLKFLEREGYSYQDNMPHNVLCFEYDQSKGAFVNRTVFGHGCV